MIRVVCAIIENKGLFLVARRAAESSQALLWEFPGGKIESGENPVQALVREIKEELGISVAVQKPLQANVHHYTDKSIELIPFVCTPVLDGAVATAHEHAEIRWVDGIEAQTLRWAAADVPILNEYLEIKK